MSDDESTVNSQIEFKSHQANSKVKNKSREKVVNNAVVDKIKKSNKNVPLSFTTAAFDFDQYKYSAKNGRKSSRISRTT